MCGQAKLLSMSIRYITAGSGPQFTANLHNSLALSVPKAHNKRNYIQFHFLSLCRLEQPAMPSRLPVVLVSLLLTTPVVLFWLWLVLQPAIVAKLCPGECRCDILGYYVNCSGSGLKNFPSTLPTHVRKLELDGNRIPFIETGILSSRGLVELKILKVGFCNISQVDLGAFDGLTKLVHLSMNHNNISEIIPGTFEKISSLEYLYLKHNRIERLGVDLFSGLVNLKYVNLEENNLQCLHPDAFLGLPNLQSVYLSQNSRLQMPHDRNFINSHSLKQLGISDCNTRSVSVVTFANVSALEKLDLSYNNLRSLDINILKALPKLSALYLHGNPLRCDCQLQKVRRWCLDHNIQTTYAKIAPQCDTPREVKRMWWGVLEKGQCLGSNIHYRGDYKNTSYSYKNFEGTKKENYKDTETEQGNDISSFFRQHILLISAVFFIFGTTGNIILIITITYNKNMRTVPNMYILNVAVSDMIILTVLFADAFGDKISNKWLYGKFMCTVVPFCYRMSVGLTTYSIAVFSIQRYRVTVDPLQVLVSSQPTWRSTFATICGVWIVAALFAIPAAVSKHLCGGPSLIWSTDYYQYVAIFHLLGSCVLPLFVIAFCYIMMARHLVESSCSVSKKTQNSRLNTRKNTAKVVLGLAVVSLISYLPYHISETYIYSRLMEDFSSASYSDKFGWFNNLIDINVILRHLLSINSCLNPVALCYTSRAFRRHFKRYLTCCCKAKSPPTDLELTRGN
jgi:Leucine-rich repeat (LRR) protein